MSCVERRETGRGTGNGDRGSLRSLGSRELGRYGLPNAVSTAAVTRGGCAGETWGRPKVDVEDGLGVTSRLTGGRKVLGSGVVCHRENTRPLPRSMGGEIRPRPFGPT